jgi:hypothetical protein
MLQAFDRKAPLVRNVAVPPTSWRRSSFDGTLAVTTRVVRTAIYAVSVRLSWDCAADVPCSGKEGLRARTPEPIPEPDKLFFFASLTKKSDLIFR